MKVIYRLGQLGYVETIRGRGGGIRLGMEPEDINIGEVVRKTEDDFNIVECFDANKNLCVISPVCGLKHVLNEALFGLPHSFRQIHTARPRQKQRRYHEAFKNEGID